MCQACGFVSFTLLKSLSVGWVGTSSLKASFEKLSVHDLSFQAGMVRFTGEGSYRNVREKKRGKVVHSTTVAFETDNSTAPRVAVAGDSGTGAYRFWAGVAAVAVGGGDRQLWRWTVMSVPVGGDKQRLQLFPRRCRF